jgi:hypothetical protein
MDRDLLSTKLCIKYNHSMVQDIISKADCLSACQKVSFLMEPEGSLPYLHKPAIRPYSEPAESSSPHPSVSP